MSDNRPLAFSLSAGAGVCLLEIHFDDRCSVGIDPLVDLHEETLEAALLRGGSADGLHPPENAECPLCIAAREWQRGKKFQERLNVRMCLGVIRFSASRAELGYRRLSPPPSGRARTRAATPDTSGTGGRIHMPRQQSEPSSLLPVMMESPAGPCRDSCPEICASAHW